MRENIGEKAIRCLRTLEAYDFATLRQMYTKTATVWHNDGAGEQTIDEKLEQLKPLVGTVGSLRYDVIRQFHNSNEVLQQHVLRMTASDGGENAIHATTYFRFADGLIDRMEEYTYPMPADEAGR